MSGKFYYAREVEFEVLRVLSDCLSIGGRDVKAGLRLVEDLCMDSMSMVEFVVALNEVFSIELSEEGVERCRTVRDICLLIEAECR